MRHAQLQTTLGFVRLRISKTFKCPTEPFCRYETSGVLERRTEGRKVQGVG